MTIRGAVDGRLQPVLTFRVRGPDASTATVSAVVDTGFTGGLTLPAATVAQLRLAKLTTRRVQFGTGSIRSLDVHRVDVEWDGTWREAMCNAAGNDALLGLRLLASHRRTVHVVPDGAVEVTPLPRPAIRRARWVGPVAFGGR